MAVPVINAIINFSTGPQTAQAMLDVEKQTTKSMKEWLERWLQYGENTFCESEILLTETKKLLGTSI